MTWTTNLALSVLERASTRCVTSALMLCAASASLPGCSDAAEAGPAQSAAAQAATPAAADTPAVTSPNTPGAPTGDVGPKPTKCGDIEVPPRAYAKAPPYKLGPAENGLPDYWPTTDWKAKDPSELGFDPAKLAAITAFTTPKLNTQAVLVIRHGYVAYEKYYGAFTQNTRHESYSMAKSVTSGMIGIALGEGKIPSLDEKICKYYPDKWNCNDSSDPRSRITIEHAMNLTTGLQWVEDWRSFSNAGNDAMSLGDMLDKNLARKSVAEPGTTMRYSTGDPALLTAPIQKNVGKTAYAYAKEKIFDVIGIPGVKWNQHASGMTTVFAGLSATAREFAKYGYLYLRHGQWEGKQVVPGDWIDKTTVAPRACNDWYRYFWHQNLAMRLGEQTRDLKRCPVGFCFPDTFSNVPADAFMAKGVFGQFVVIIPSEDVIIVRLAQDQAGSENWDDWGQAVIPGVLDAITK